MGNKIVRTNCFGYFKSPTGVVKCKALQDADCRGCKFYKSQEDYSKYVAPLKHKNNKKESVPIMISKGKFKFKSIEKREGGEFTNDKGQLIKYDSSYVIKVDEQTENGIYERRFKISSSDNVLVSKMQRLSAYDDIEMTFDIQFYGNSTKVVPTDVVSCNNK